MQQCIIGAAVHHAAVHHAAVHHAAVHHAAVHHAAVHHAAVHHAAVHHAAVHHSSGACDCIKVHAAGCRRLFKRGMVCNTFCELAAGEKAGGSSKQQRMNK